LRCILAGLGSSSRLNTTAKHAAAFRFDSKMWPPARLAEISRYLQLPMLYIVTAA
jgi:hypothetical protein